MDLYYRCGCDNRKCRYVSSTKQTCVSYPDPACKSFFASCLRLPLETHNPRQPFSIYRRIAEKFHVSSIISILNLKALMVQNKAKAATMMPIPFSITICILGEGIPS